MNEHVFDGELTEPLIKTPQRMRYNNNELLGAYRCIDNRLYITQTHSFTELQKNWKKPDKKYVSNWIETLFHEMCHQYQGEILEEFPLTHGVLFQSIYEKGLKKLARLLKKL